MSFVFNGPIPGQSLTSEPKGLPFERPPEINDPLEALDMHIDNMSKPEAVEDAMFFLEMGLDLVTLVEGILRSAVMEGIHSVDVSLIIAPVLHEHIKNLAIAADIDFEEGFEDADRDKALTYERDTMRAKKILSQLDNSEPEIEIEKEEEPIENEPMQEAPKGLMARV